MTSFMSSSRTAKNATIAFGKQRRKLKDAAEALLAARYLLIEANAILTDTGVKTSWLARQAILEREIGGILDSIAAGMGDK